MMTKRLLTVTALLCTLASCSKKDNPEEPTPPTPEPVEETKKLYIPARIWDIPNNNDYNNEESLYSHSRKKETENFAVFWAKDFGKNPAENAQSNKRFDLNPILVESERFYKYFRDTLKFVSKGSSVSDLYKTLIYVTNSSDATAYGGGAEDKVGVLWVTPPRINTAPYGAMAHELGHVFQYFVKTDGNWGYSSNPSGSNGQSIFEMTSQYMLWQVYPEWLTFENYHLQSYMRQTHYAFLHEINQYSTPQVLEHWSEMHGKEFVGKLWRSALRGEDPVMTYKRITNTSQEAFNNDIFHAYRKFITWDMPRIKETAKPYINQHISELNPTENGWFRINKNKCPQNYGYNGIRLNIPAASSTIQLHFKGIAGHNDYRKINIEKAGWRYGFVALKNDGTRVYSDIYSDANSQVSYTIPSNTTHLWLVVSGAPTEHWEHLNDNRDDNDEQWPYEIKIEGTTIHTTFIK